MLTLNILWLTTSNYSSPSAHKNKQYYDINLLSSGLCFQFSSLSINKSNFYYFLDNQMRTLSIFKNLCNLYNWINGYINQLLQATNQNQPFRPPLNAEKYFLKYWYIYLLSAFSSPHLQHYLFSLSVLLHPLTFTKSLAVWVYCLGFYFERNVLTILRPSFYLCV